MAGISMCSSVIRTIEHRRVLNDPETILLFIRVKLTELA